MLALLALAAALVVWLARRGRALDRRWRIAGSIAAAALVVLAAATVPPLLVLRKQLAFFAMPTTLVWLALVALVVRSWPERRWRWPLLALLIAYTLAGSSATSYLLLRGLERPFLSLRPLDAATRYDAVMVMGGGTSLFRKGGPATPQLGVSGDRLRLAAGLWARGRTQILVTSGSSVDGERDYSAEASALWRDMGVPDDAILRVPGVRNTSEEVAAYTRLVAERGWKRIGIVTSARHLPRALALCRRHGLTAEPLPTDFRSEPPPSSLFLLVPEGEAFADVEDATWEYLGIAAVHLFGG